MATIKLKLTKDHLALISNIRFTEIPDIENETKQTMTWGLDFNSLYGGSYVFEDIAFILGRYDEHILGTEEDAMGPRFEKDFEDYMWELHTYIINNIEYIETLVHQFINKGGLTEGTYKCKDYEKIWTKID